MSLREWYALCVIGIALSLGLGISAWLMHRLATILGVLFVCSVVVTVLSFKGTAHRKRVLQEREEK